MGHFKIVVYSPKLYASWNNFLDYSKNATFLFHRDFMDYHKDRFKDFSLMIFKNDKVVGLLPANRENNKMHSHQGLTYGGLILPKSIKFKEVKELIYSVLKFINDKGINELIVRQIPSIYFEELSYELDYLHFVLKSEIIRKDNLSCIDMKSSFKISDNRIEGLKRAEKHGLILKEEDTFDAFWNEILIPNLEIRYKVKPVHNLDEISYLKSKFPKNIRQFNVYHNDKIVAGTTIFESNKVAHSQYISGNSENNELGSLDFLYIKLIRDVFKNKPYVDFGSSNENMGRQINEGLQFWKEGFGARTITQDFYKIKTRNYILLDSMFI